MSSYDVGIRCGFLLSMAGGDTQVETDRFLGIRGSRIAEIRPWQSGDERLAPKFIDARDKLVMPGLINGHTHLPMTLLRGLAEDLPLHAWLTQLIFPIEGKMVDERFVRIGSELALFESMRSGVTTVCEQYFFTNAIADVVDRVGMRALIGQAVVDFPTPDNKKMDGSDYRIADELRQKYQSHERISPGLTCHAPYTVSDESFKKARDYCGRYGLTLQVHVAETAKEVEDSQNQYGKSPVQRLYDLGVMDVPCIFAHCVHVDANDIKRMAETGTSAIHNPESNMKLSSGIAPVGAMIEAGVKLGLGTDGAASNNDLNLFLEMGSGAKLQKLGPIDGRVATAKDLLRMATIDGARALGLEESIGSLETGKLADLIVIDLSAPSMQPLYEIPNQLVYAAGGVHVETVLCHGKPVMEKRQPIHVDITRLYDEVNAIADEIRAFRQSGSKA